MIVTIYRHAQALHNVEPHDYSIFDPELTPLGREQTAKARKHAKSTDLILSSSSRRALQTAELIFPNQRIFATQRLVEYNTGVACNKTQPYTDLREEFPEVDYEFWDFAPGIELTWNDGFDRALQFREFLVDLMLRTAKNRVTLISHKDFIKNLFYVFGFPEEDLRNCEGVQFDVPIARGMR